MYIDKWTEDESLTNQKLVEMLEQIDKEARVRLLHEDNDGLLALTYTTARLINALKTQLPKSPT